MVRKLPILRMRRGFLAAGMCLALSACENPLAGETPLPETLLSKGWLLEKMGLDRTSTPTKPVQPLYCYETLGVSDCYDQPLEDGGNRLVAFEGPAPEMEPLPTTR